MKALCHLLFLQGLFRSYFNFISYKNALLVRLPGLKVQASQRSLERLVFSFASLTLVFYWPVNFPNFESRLRVTYAEGAAQPTYFPIWSFLCYRIFERLCGFSIFADLWMIINLSLVEHMQIWIYLDLGFNDIITCWKYRVAYPQLLQFPDYGLITTSLVLLN